MRTKEYENRKVFSFNLDAGSVFLLKKRYSNVSEVLNELIEKHLETLGVNEKDKITASVQAEKKQENDLILKEKRHGKRISAQAELNRELYNAVYFRFRKSKNSELKRIELFEKAIRDSELAEELKEELIKCQQQER